MRDARLLLGRIVLPGRARPSQSDPGDRLAAPAQCPGVGDLIDRHRWWVVPRKPEAVEAFLEAHPPTGSRRDLWGVSGGPDGMSWEVRFRWSADTVLFQSRALMVKLVELPGGRTGVRADAQVVWTLPKAPRDAIPATARVLELMVARPGEGPNVPAEAPTVSLTVTEPEKVAAIATAINKMPLLQPGIWHCPEIPAEGPILTLTFLTSTGGEIVARASMPAWVRSEQTSCFPLTLTLPALGKSVSLGEGSIVTVVEEVLGVPVFTSA